jgi:hypothetical protein
MKKEIMNNNSKYPYITKRRFTQPKDIGEDHRYVFDSCLGLSYDHEDDLRDETVFIWDTFYRIDESDPEWKYSHSRKTVSGVSKFLCVGGPFDGLRKTENGAGSDYYAYNLASSSRYRRGAKRPAPGEPYSCVLIHVDLCVETT